MARRVLISDAKTTDPGRIAEAIEGVDVEIETTVAHEREAVVEEAAGAEALIVDANTPLGEEVLAELDDLSVIGRAGIGVDNVAIDAANALGIDVVHVPDYCIDEVSTHALALLLSCLRRTGVYDRSIREGEWDWMVGKPIRRLAGSTVGLVAFGRIARRTAEKLAGFDVDLLAYDPYVSAEEMETANVEKVALEDLLARSNAVSIHAPLTEETEGMFDAEAFERMREDAILVNTARGPLVEEDALLAALEADRIDAAGLDVREPEPPADSPLHDREDVVLTPHAAWYSEASRADLSESVARDVARVLRGESPENRVDPESGWF